jgi:hypothetical protein
MRPFGDVAVSVWVLAVGCQTWLRPEHRHQCISISALVLLNLEPRSHPSDLNAPSDDRVVTTTPLAALLTKPSPECYRSAFRSFSSRSTAT